MLTFGRRWKDAKPAGGSSPSHPVRNRMECPTLSYCQHLTGDCWTQVRGGLQRLERVLGVRLWERHLRIVRGKSGGVGKQGRPEPQPRPRLLPGQRSVTSAPLSRLQTDSIQDFLSCYYMKEDVTTIMKFMRKQGFDWTRERTSLAVMKLVLKHFVLVGK